MNNIPQPIFEKKILEISWQKIYEREYGVGYSEVAVSILAFEKEHFPKTSVAQIIVPGAKNNTAFYIDAKSWAMLVEGLNKKYTSHVKKLEAYEKQFILDGKAYLRTANKIASKNLEQYSDKALLQKLLDYKEKQDMYSVFAWSAFILNNYVADRATAILDSYIIKYKKENEKQIIYDSLFRPEKRAAILQLQYEVAKRKGKLTDEEFEKLFNIYKWLSCLDIHNAPFTKEEFANQIEPFGTFSEKKIVPFATYMRQFMITQKDAQYLHMAKRFVYIKDARDDFRRESVFYANNLFAEIARRMGIDVADISYLLSQEISDFLQNKKPFLSSIISERKKGFIIYLDKERKPVCLSGNQIVQGLRLFGLLNKKEEAKIIVGRVASQGKAKGKVVIVHGVKDLPKVQIGNILVAVTTHPDYVYAMRKTVAIVTDEGGITSHAAIVAREFGIPCIVGCKNVTRLLKDGDMVEVDAISGKVIKI